MSLKIAATSDRIRKDLKDLIMGQGGLRYEEDRNAYQRR